MSDAPKKESSYLQSIKPRHPHLRHLSAVHDNDQRTLIQKESEYDASWKKRGGTGAYMMLARKWDRIEAQCQREDVGYNIFHAIRMDTREEGILDDIRDLRRYLALVEAEMIEQNIIGPPAMERTDWNSLNAASREALKIPLEDRKFDTDQAQDTEFCNVRKLYSDIRCSLPARHNGAHSWEDVKPDTDQAQDKIPWMPKMPDPNDRPPTEMIKHDATIVDEYTADVIKVLDSMMFAAPEMQPHWMEQLSEKYNRLKRAQWRVT